MSCRAVDRTQMASILIVEDEPRVAEVIADVLRQFNHEPRMAESAGGALMMAELERPDAILLDIRLPDSSGISTLEVLRQVRPDVPIIMVTGNTDAELARDTLKCGAFDYIMKPFDLSRLARVVEIALAS
jgi:DNA-binding NtrC family response regulator